MIRTSAVQPDVQRENMRSILGFLKTSYSTARKGIHDGASFFKDEFTSFYDKTGTYFNRMMLPVNNFLKDIAQINTELHEEETRTHDFLVPVEQAAQSPMEENY